MAKKRYPIVWTAKARADLRKVYDYLCDHADADKALGMVNAILDKASILSSGSSLGQREPFLVKLKREYRRLIIKDYKIIYSFRKNTIYIHCVFDSRQNPKLMKVK